MKTRILFFAIAQATFAMDNVAEDGYDMEQPSKGIYVIQVSVSPAEASARKIIQKLADDGIKAYSAKVENPDPDKGMIGVYYRVRIGFFDKRASAEEFAKARLEPLGYQWWIDRSKNDNIGKVVKKIPEQALEQQKPEQQPELEPEQMEVALDVEEDEYFKPEVYVQRGNEKGMPQWLGMGLMVAGIGAGVYGFLQNLKYDEFHNDFKNAKSVNEEKASEHKAKKAKSRRDMGYIIGSALFAGGIIIYVVF